MPFLEAERVKKEVEEINQAGAGYKVYKQVTDDASQWRAVIDGPKGTPYEGGNYLVDLSYPAAYNERAPQVLFYTKIHHPNIGPDQTQLGILGDTWTHTYTTKTAFDAIVDLLKNPKPDNAINAEIGEQYKNDRAAFDKEAKETNELASRSVEEQEAELST